MCSLEQLSELCTIWASKAQLLGSKIGPKFQSLDIFSKSFHWFQISIVSHAHCNYFQRCVEYGPQGASFGTNMYHLGPKISQNSNLWSKSFHWFHTSIASHAHCKYVWRCGEYWLQRPNLVHSGPQNRSKLQPLVIFSKRFHWFRIRLGLHVNLSYFQRCVEYWPQRSNFQVILRPEIYHNSGLQSFEWFFINLVLHARWGYF